MNAPAKTGGAPRIGGSSATAPRHLDTIRDAVGSDRFIAAVIGVSPSQVSRWRSGQFPGIENADRLAGFALVVEMLGRWLHRSSIRVWLEGPNGHLQGGSPAHMIRHGHIADVIGAIEAEKAGAFS